MKRELVENHRCNQARRIQDPNNKEWLWFVRAVIECDGREELFVAVNKDILKANDIIQSYLNEECICVAGADLYLCPIHGEILCIAQ